jgi:UDP-3-O-[3-hydroxymyristoyl] glucosamine N-acyltransferase
VSSTIRQLATLVRGEASGDQETVIKSARRLPEAAAGDITYLYHAWEMEAFNRSHAAAAVVAANLPTCTKALIRVKDPEGAFAAIVEHLAMKTAEGSPIIHPQAVVHPGACIGGDTTIDRFAVIGANTVIGARCRIAAGVVIGASCRIGDDVVLHPRVVIYDDTVIGDRVTVGPRSVIGADGFGYRFQRGRHVKVPQLGNVVIGADVEIGAGAAIDRGAFGSTTIGAGTKIGNLSQIAHNCRIGRHNQFANQVGIGGSTCTGENVVLGDQAGIKDHMDIGDDTVLRPGTGVIQAVRAGSRLFLYPAEEEADAEQIVAGMTDLPKMSEDLERVLEALGATSDS